MCIYTSVAITLLLSLAFIPQDQNYKPEVAVSVQGNTFRWNSIIPYSISVSDVEDGNTDYNEISSNEVVLVAKYLPESEIVTENVLTKR